MHAPGTLSSHWLVVPPRFTKIYKEAWPPGPSNHQHCQHTTMISRLARPLRTQLRQGSRQLQRRQYSSGSSSKGGSDLPWAATGLALFVIPTAYVVNSWTNPPKPAPKKKEEYEMPALPPIDATEVTAKVPSADVDAIKEKEENFSKEKEEAAKKGGNEGKDFDEAVLAKNQPDLKWKDDGTRDAEIADKRAKATDEDDGHQKEGIKELRDQDLIDDDRLKGKKTDGGPPSKPEGEKFQDAPHGVSEKTSETVPAKEHSPEEHKPEKGAQDVEPKAERDAEAEKRLAKEKKLDKESDDYVEKESWADEQVQK
ncbi:hypothetical protein B0I73DRAFT_132277 [Yarrowia lipolytica]|nr:hypothetical protein B0I73DRAFT_132277 [Yarrowia lipolytica]